MPFPEKTGEYRPSDDQKKQHLYDKMHDLLVPRPPAEIDIFVLFHRGIASGMFTFER
jgi:hypothetical protein